MGGNPTVGVSNPLRKRSAVAMLNKPSAELCLFLYTYSGRLLHCEVGLSPSVHGIIVGERLEFPV